MKRLSMFLGLALLASAAQAQSAKSTVDARRIFDEMRAKYAAMETYSHRLEPKKLNGKVQPASVEFSFQQPNRYAVRMKRPEGDWISVSNGRTNYFYDSRQSKTKYYALPMPPQELGRIGLMQYAISGIVLSPLLAGVDPFSTPWGEAPRGFSRGKSTKVNGVPVDTIVVRLAGDYNEVATYFIGQKDRLLHRFISTAGKGKDSYTYTETFTDIRVNPKIPIETFAFVPPPNTKQEDPMKPYFNGDIPENLRIGAVPPPVEGTNLEAQPVRLEDYKGKVVLLDFWATWCGPCTVDTPHIKAAYEKFHDQGFEVIGISFDQDRKALEKYINEKNLPWPQLFDSKMFEGEIATNYKIRGIPTYFLIGRDGKIAAFNPQKLLLEPAIVKALNTPAPE